MGEHVHLIEATTGLQPLTNIPEAAVALATSEAHRQARALRDFTNASDPELAFFFGQVAYLFSRCRAGHAPTRRDFLGLALVAQRAFNRGGRG